MRTRTDATIPYPSIDRESREVAEFQRAMEGYERRSGRSSPTWSEAFKVMRGLGYSRPSAGASRPLPLLVRVNREGLAGRQIGETLARWGGIPSRGDGHAHYAFDSDGDRADALDMVRREYGWSSVDPL